MRYSKILLCLLALQFLAGRCIGRHSIVIIKYNKQSSPKAATILISGASLKPNVSINLPSTIVKKRAVNVNETCKFIIPNQQKLRYFSVIADDDENDERVNNIMLLPGDSLVIEIDNGIKNISGIGAQKNIIHQHINAAASDSNYTNKSAIASFVMNSDLRYKLRGNKLAEEKDVLGTTVYASINSDVKYKTLLDLANFYLFYLAAVPSSYEEIQKYYDVYGLPIDSNDLVTPLTQSQYFYDYLIAREFVRIKLLNRKNQSLGISSTEDNIPSIYNSLKQLYKRPLGEYLIAQFLSNRYRSFVTDSLFTDALSYIELPEISGAIRAMQRKVGKGVPAYDFKLKDTTDKYVTLHSLKGKVLVIDFWIEHCGPCIKLAKDLKRISDTLGSNNNVLFVSISAEPDTAIWKKVIRAGTHTFPGQLHLYTNGVGAEHPLLKHYGYNGFPQLLIIDKEGHIISSRPERPGDAAKSEAFLALLRSYL